MKAHWFFLLSLVLIALLSGYSIPAAESFVASSQDKDNDRDGYTVFHGDCDDHNPGIHPGAYDDPANTVDEDCYGEAKKRGAEVTCVPASDIPVNAARRPAPPLIMFLVDDSGSMDFECLVPGAEDQIFAGEYAYIFPSAASEHWGIGYGYPSLSVEARRLWKSQWAGHNRLYFNPNTTYLPWPKWEHLSGANVRTYERAYNPSKGTFPDTAYIEGFTHADMDFPRLNSHGLSSAKNAFYHSGSDNTKSIHNEELNATFLTVKLDGQQIKLTRDENDTNKLSFADAIGFSPSNNIEVSVPQKNVLGNISASSFVSIVDNESGTSLYEETGDWHHLEENVDKNICFVNARYTNQYSAAATWYPSLNTTQAATGPFHVYAWINNSNARDQHARYSLTYYDQSGSLTTVAYSRDQNVGNLWLRITDADKPIPFRVSTVGEIVVPYAHYFTINDSNHNGTLDDGEDVYLITINGSRIATNGVYSLHYYKFNDANNNNFVDNGELKEVVDNEIPEGIVPKKYDAAGTLIDHRTQSQQLAYIVRQDFADWFSFYRRRMLAAKAAIGLAVSDMKDVSLGLHHLNRENNLHLPLQYMATANGAEKLDFLAGVYNLRPTIGGTPLRRGLYEVGKYFEAGDSGDYWNARPGASDTDNLRTTRGLCAGDSSVFWGDKNDKKGSGNERCGTSGGECQRSFVIVLTDGYDNLHFSAVGNSDFVAETAFQDAASDSLADIAMYFYKGGVHNDLDTGLANKIPPKGFDANTAQHLVTYTIAFGVSGMFDPVLFPDCLPGCGQPGKGKCPSLDTITQLSWENYAAGIGKSNGIFPKKCPAWWNEDPNSSLPSQKSIDDLYHAAVNGRGKFINAADPGQLVTTMQTIKNLVVDHVGTAASLSINAKKIQDNSLLFQTTYDSADWSGDLLAKCLDKTGAVISCNRAPCQRSCNSSYATCINACAEESVCETGCRDMQESCIQGSNCMTELPCTTDHDRCLTACANNITCRLECAAARQTCLQNPPEVKWSAVNELAKLSNASASRNILTANDLGQGIPFQWNSLPAGMQTLLQGDVDLLQYLRGDRSHESQYESIGEKHFRNRAAVLGDFINSEPYHYANTTLGIDWVMVGGNDGMLHVFDSNTGKEVFAYVPRAVFARLASLAASTYSENHKFYVDGYLTVKDLGGSVILVGGLGKGGKGYFALNLSKAAQWAHAAAVSPGDGSRSIENNAADIVLWEYSDITQSANASIASFLGYSFSRPQIVKSNDSSAAWVLLFGNGYESARKKAALFTVGLSRAGDILWTTLIDTGSGGANSNCNGLSSVAAVYPQGDGQEDFLYAGDLLGNLWKFDISSANRKEWNIYFHNTAGVGQPLFQARSSAGWRQPITIQPDITSSCASGSKGYLVTFGTGRLLNPDVDFVDQSVQTVYGLWDWSQAWAEVGIDPRSTYFGSFMPNNESVATSCSASCDAISWGTNAVDSCASGCGGVHECEATCASSYATCKENCKVIRNVSNMSNILGRSSAPYVGLLQQTQVWGGGLTYNKENVLASQVYGASDGTVSDQIVRIVSKKTIDWYLPTEKSEFELSNLKAAKHVGWYFDLPVNGERVVRDMAIVNGKLLFASTVPSDSSCESAGHTTYWSVNVCTGSRLDKPLFNINGDKFVDNKDYINIGPNEKPLWAPVSSIESAGINAAPTIVEVEGCLDKAYYSHGRDVMENSVDAFGWPITYWRDLEWK